MKIQTAIAMIIIQEANMTDKIAVLKYSDYVGEDEFDGIMIESEQKGTLLNARARRNL